MYVRASVPCRAWWGGGGRRGWGEKGVSVTRSGSVIRSMSMTCVLIFGKNVIRGYHSPMHVIISFESYTYIYILIGVRLPSLVC